MRGKKEEKIIILNSKIVILKTNEVNSYIFLIGFHIKNQAVKMNWKIMSSTAFLQNYLFLKPQNFQ